MHRRARQMVTRDGEDLSFEWETAKTERRSRRFVVLLQFRKKLWAIHTIDEKTTTFSSKSCHTSIHPIFDLIRLRMSMTIANIFVNQISTISLLVLDTSLQVASSISKRAVPS